MEPTVTTASPLRATLVLLAACGTLTVGACSGSTQSPPAQPAASSGSSVTVSSAPTSSTPSTAATGSASSTAAVAPSTSAPPSQPASPSAPAAAPAAITIKDFMFTVPAAVAPGATVMVTNADAQSHTVTSKDGGFDVKVDGHGGVATLTAPKTAGTYTLTCDFHANMTGALTVR